MDMNVPKIKTNRTTLRLADINDLEFVHELHSLPETDEFNTVGIPNNIDETKLVINNWIKAHQQSEVTSYTFTIQLNSNDEKIGVFGLKLWPKKNRRAEVWYKIHKDNWDQGYATEILKSVLDFGFDELNLHRIQAGSAVDNIGSIKVLEKSGMIREGRGRQLLLLKSGWSDNFEYSILETDKR
jgi:RimJ/RimL family protein N-acetyltransferase